MLDFEFSPEQEKLRSEIRSALGEVMTPERVEALKDRNAEGGPTVKECVRELGAANLLGVGWPKEFGGRGFTALEQYIFLEEAQRLNTPIPMITLNTVGPTLMQFGTQEQKERFLPDILKGTVEFAIGYTEPSSGSDLASLRTAAVRDGDEYVINGSKMFTSGAAFADYIWLATRTDPERRTQRHIDLHGPHDLEGFSWRPLHTMPGVSTYYTFYDDVRVPRRRLSQARTRGWKMITTQLNFERASLGNLAALQPMFEKVLEWGAKHSKKTVGK